MKKILSTMILALVCICATAQYSKEVFYQRGRIALRDGKYSTAISNFNILEQLDSANYWNYFFRGIAKFNLGDMRGARMDFDRSIRINPVFTDGYHYRAITKSSAGQYEDALKDLEKAIELRPGFAGLYFSRGVTYLLFGKYREAVEDFNRYIRKEPKDPVALLNRGSSYLMLNDTTKALIDYNSAIRLNRFEPEGYIRRARLYASLEDFPKAAADLDRAIDLDSTNTFAYFNRALVKSEMHDCNGAMKDLNHVLAKEPGNALTLYNRSLIYAQMGDFQSALDDIDRVININPKNVLAYFNRASFFVQMSRWEDALTDYNTAIGLYPDFAKAYLNRSYVENKMGLKKASKTDYDTAQKKIKEYRERGVGQEFADTSKKFNSLLALDANFSHSSFNNEMLQHRDVDVRLQPLYRVVETLNKGGRKTALTNKFESALVDKFIDECPVGMIISRTDTCKTSGAWINPSSVPQSEYAFIQGVRMLKDKQYNSALQFFNQAVDLAEKDVGTDKYAIYYKALYLMNRAVLKAEMIEYIASIENNVQTITLDDKGNTRSKVNAKATRNYDYSDALADMLAAEKIIRDNPYVHYDIGNLYCLSSQLVEALKAYDTAIRLHPYLGEAYYNRGLLLIYVKDREKGCIDLSRAGELGIKDAYSIISKYCKSEE